MSGLRPVASNHSVVSHDVIWPEASLRLTRGRPLERGGQAVKYRATLSLVVSWERSRVSTAAVAVTSSQTSNRTNA